MREGQKIIAALQSEAFGYGKPASGLRDPANGAKRKSFCSKRAIRLLVSEKQQQENPQGKIGSQAERRRCRTGRRKKGRRTARVASRGD